MELRIYKTITTPVSRPIYRKLFNMQNHQDFRKLQQSLKKNTMAHQAPEETIHLVKEIFRTYLKERNQRQTPERFMVLEEIYTSGGHYDADDIFFNMKNAGTRVSRATVYNTLDLLIECGLVQRQQFGKNQYYYERSYAYQQHDHMICKECGVVIEFCDPRLFEIQKMMESIHNFKVEGHSLHLYGTCKNTADCKRRQENGKKIKTI